MSDETLIDRAVRRTRREYEGEDRRAPPPYSFGDALKWLPLVIVAVTAAVGYGGLTQRVAALEKHADKADDSHNALWRALREVER